MEDEPVRPLVPRPRGLQPPTYPSTPVLPSPTTPRSILKTSDSTAAPRSEASTSTSHSSTSSSPSKLERQKIAKLERNDPMRVTPVNKVKEGAFFAFVLLPLSCWYTRGGKRLKDLDDFDDEPFRPRPSQQLARRSSVSATPSMQLQRRSSVSVSMPMQSPGPGRW
ncbi:uncharacterized protein LY89DRAFT_730243 [Mollisia scopiformis]|uniref:Uncharacterized protein n=1 Tax=Mollisia scopiformis TaxID=149040 RepID=A0A194XMW2_MOLSC|nr:uncharacterized protein LY89DRAFT_730243 [Mollisia scopiformis]KUJ21466.1 hypothetical protein LY89DRAFT_730243 [Mollisia scopiformis]